MKGFLVTLCKRLSASLTRNIGLKVGSLFLATILWVTITGQGTDDRILREVPYQIGNVPADMILTDKGIGFVDIYIRGPRSMITTIRPDDCSASLSLPENSEMGTVEIEIDHSDIVIPYPNQVSLLQVSPSSVTVALDELITKTVRIQPFLRGSPHPDYQLGKTQIEPDNAELQGPRTYLDNVESVFTEPIDIANQTRSFNERVSLKPGSPLVSVLQPSRASAMIEILERTIERSFPEFEVTVLSNAHDPSIIVSPTVVILTITGPASTLNKLTPSDIQLVINTDNLKPGRQLVSPTFVSAHGKMLSFRVEPEKIEVVIPEPKLIEPDETSLNISNEDRGFIVDMV
ncbi:MAG: CdaR family protein [bacterium]